MSTHSLAGSRPGHLFGCRATTYANFANPKIEAMLLRGIAWAGEKSRWMSL